MSNVWDKHCDETYVRASEKIRPKPVTYAAIRAITGISIEAIKKYLGPRPMLQKSIGLVTGPQRRGPKQRRGAAAELMERLLEAASDIWGADEVPTIPKLAGEAGVTYRRALTFLRRETKFRHMLVEHYHLLVNPDEQ